MGPASATRRGAALTPATTKIIAADKTANFGDIIGANILIKIMVN
ncbi:MAG TPA: hypothetical protein VFS97_14220 [Nitrososphaeraceae archaeon]|nr:hypothetical protein [Nitrososphaeraceae archaeon]